MSNAQVSVLSVRNDKKIFIYADIWHGIKQRSIMMVRQPRWVIRKSHFPPFPVLFAGEAFVRGRTNIDLALARFSICMCEQHGKCESLLKHCSEQATKRTSLTLSLPSAFRAEKKQVAKRHNNHNIG